MLSGLPEDDTNLRGVLSLAAAAPDAHLAVQRALALAEGPLGPPGHTQRYSNTSFELLGLLIHAVTGKSLGAALRADLFGPAQLRRIAVQDDQRPPAPLAYPVDTRGPTEDGYLPDRAIAGLAAGAGSIAADAATVARWGYELYGGLVLPTAMTTAMTTPQIQSGIGYGLGTVIFRDYAGSHPAVGHTGLIGVPAPHRPRGVFDGYTSLLVAVPDLRVSVAVLAPAVQVNLSSIANELLAAATQ
jgi:CubicO group peptidase (beta-lactamase class C family)